MATKTTTEGVVRVKRLPKELYVYVFDHDEEGKPLYAVASTVDQISEEYDTDFVGLYRLQETRIFTVIRALK